MEIQVNRIEGETFKRDKMFTVKAMTAWRGPWTRTWDTAVIYNGEDRYDDSSCHSRHDPMLGLSLGFFAYEMMLPHFG
jgi:hypothetical protein